MKLRPRWLYFSVFVWLASHGRFAALFFAEQGLSDTKIGVLMALYPLLSCASAPLLGLLADRAEARRAQLPGIPWRGHEAALALSIVVTSASFLLLALNPRVPAGRPRFAFFVACQALYAIALSPLFGILDGLSLRYLDAAGLGKAAYGIERLWGAVGWAMANLALGALADARGLQSVTYPFLAATTLVLLATLSVYSATGGTTTAEAAASSAHAALTQSDDARVLDLENDVVAEEEESGEDVGLKATSSFASTDDQEHMRSSGSRSSRDGASTLRGLLWSFLGTPSRCGFVLALCVLSAGAAIVEKLLFLFFSEELEASYLICGLSVAITVIFEIPIFAYAQPLLAKCGAARLLCVAGGAYATRVIGYTLVPNQYAVLALEPLHGITYSCLKTATVQYVVEVTPPGLDATAQTLMSALTGLFGNLVGMCLGGWVQDRFGAHALYRGAAGLVSAALLVYGALAAAQASTQATGASPVPSFGYETGSCATIAQVDDSGLDVKAAATDLKQPKRGRAWRVREAQQLHLQVLKAMGKYSELTPHRQ